MRLILIWCRSYASWSYWPSTMLDGWGHGLGRMDLEVEETMTMKNSSKEEGTIMMLAIAITLSLVRFAIVEACNWNRLYFHTKKELTILCMNLTLDHPLTTLRSMQADEWWVRNTYKSMQWVIQWLIHTKKDESLFRIKDATHVLWELSRGCRPKEYKEVHDLVMCPLPFIFFSIWSISNFQNK